MSVHEKSNGANKNDLPPFSLHHSGWQLSLSGKTEKLLSNWKFMYTDLSLSLLIYSVSNSVIVLNFQSSWDRFWLWQISKLLQSSLLGFDNPFDLILIWIQTPHKITELEFSFGNLSIIHQETSLSYIGQDFKPFQDF